MPDSGMRQLTQLFWMTDDTAFFLGQIASRSQTGWDAYKYILKLSDGGEVVETYRVSEEGNKMPKSLHYSETLVLLM